jgi:HEPN domain-containing protein
LCGAFLKKARYYLKSLANEWIDKAEGDFATLLREVRARSKPNYDAACFHAQQCAEKYLKSILSENDIEFGRIHDLAVLLTKALPVVPELELQRENLLFLTDFSVNTRYPGISMSKDDAKFALKRCKDFRSAVRGALTLKD